MSAWAAETADVTYDFTGSDWSVSNGTLSNGTVSFTGSGTDNFKMNSGYFMMGKSGAYIDFPKYESAVEKIVVTGRSGASTAVKQNIFVGENSASTETTGAAGTNTYEIASAYQAAGTQYTLKVTSNHNTQITKIEVYFATGETPTCSSPTFSPEAGAVASGTKVAISCTTTGATIYYTTDGTDPTPNSTVYSEPIKITEAMTIKAYAAKEDYNDSEIVTADYTIKEMIHGYAIDFEDDIDIYADWTFANVVNTNTAITAHGGSKYGANINANGSGVSSLAIQTKEKVALPNVFTCYVSKTSTNTTSSTWTVSVSSDGNVWENVVTKDATSMTKGVWDEFTANLSTYSDVYVKIAYSGTTAIRAIDDITLTERDPNSKITPNIVIDATELTTDLAGETNVNAGTVTATVTAGQTTVENVSITWTSSNTDVATIDATTGAVTLIATGTTTLTATFAGNDDYNEATGTYTLTVVDSEGPGSVKNPFTVADAIAAVNNSTYDPNQTYYISGIVSSFYNESIIGDGNNFRYYISDEGTTETQLLVYKGKGLNEATFANADDLLVGDEVVIAGKLTVYNNAPEIAANNYLYSWHRKSVKYYLAGSFDNDSWENGMIEMTKDGNTYTAEKAFEAKTEFKIVKIDETNNNKTIWYGGATNDATYGIHSGWYENIPLSSDGKNFKIDAASDDKYTFTVNAENPDSLTLTVTGWHVPEVKYYLAGNWTDNWSEGKIELTENANGTFSCSQLVGNGTRFKFVKTVDDAETWYGATQTGNDYGIHSEWCTGIALSDASDASAFVMQMASNNDLVFTLNVSDMTFDVTGWPISLEGNLFVKVTSYDEFTDGAYLIVYEGGNVAFNGGLDTLDVASNTISVNIVNNTIVADSTTKAALFTIVNNGKITSASGHYIGVSSFSNGLKLDGYATMYNNSVTFDDNGNATIAINTGSDGSVYLKYNNGSNQNRFRYYKSGQQAIQLYKLVTAEQSDSYTVTVGTAGWATYVAEANVTFDSNVTAYIVTGTTADAVQLQEVLAVVKGTPVVVKATAGTYNLEVVDAEDCDVVANSNRLLVSDGSITADDGVYVLANKTSGVGFYKWAGGTLSAGRVYLPSQSGARSFLSLGGGTTTGIDSMEAVNQDSFRVYDLQGRHVAQPTKGLYIMNGKKVVLK